MCPSHITHKWAREVLLTIPRARAFLIEDMRNGGDPSRPHGICEVKLSKGKTVYEGKRLSLAEMRRMGRKEWRKRFPGPTFFITGKDKGKLGYFWEHVYLKAKSGPNLGGVVNPDSGVAILDSEMQKLTALDFTDKLKVSEALTAPRGGTTRFSALWQADRTRIQRMAPIEYIGRYMRGWFDFAIADELHQLAGDTAQGNGLGVLGRAAQRLIALTGTLMGGYADDLFNIFYRMEPHAMVREGFAYGGQGRRDFQEQYGVLETIEKVEEADNACSRATKKTVRVLRKPGASPMLFGKFLMTTTAFLSLEDISDNLPRYDESVISVDMDDALQQAYEKLEEDIRSAMKAHRGNKSLMSILLNTLLLYPDHPYDFDEIWARAFDPQTKEYVKFLVTEPENLTREALYAKERALIADVKEELRQGRRCQVYATYTGEKDVTLRLEAVLRQEGIRVAILRSSVATDKREDWYERQLKAGVEVVICHPKLVETGLDLLAFPTLYFYETGYSLHTLRQASRRSWRIGQRFPVRVKFVTYSGHDAGDLPPFDGQEDAGRAHDGGQVLGRRSAGARHRRRPDERDGAGTGREGRCRRIRRCCVAGPRPRTRESAAAPGCCGTRIRRGVRPGARPAGLDRCRTGSGAIRHPPDWTELATKEAEEDRTLADRHRNQCAAQPLRLSQARFQLER
jgi:hypothetical protein